MINKLKRFFCAPERWEDDYYDRIDGWRCRMVIISVLCSILIVGGIIYMAMFNAEALKCIVSILGVLGITVALSYLIYSIIAGGR